MLTKEELFRQLKNMNAPQDRVVIMHAAFRTVGEVQGGAEGFLDALIEYFTAKGGLFCIPTHTWHHLEKDVITLDLLHPESNLGLLPTLAANRKDGVRSKNPCHSMMVFGDRARAEGFVAGEEQIKTPTAPDSCYGKLYREQGLVLLVGVSQAANTYLHTVDEILALPNRMAKTPISTTVRHLNGEITTQKLHLFDCSFSEDICERFPKYDVAFRYHGATTDGFIGRAPAQLCDAVRMKEVVELIWKNSGGEDPLATEKPIPPAWFCTKR